MNRRSESKAIKALNKPDDRESLGFIQGRGMTIGFVDEVNGPGSVECADFRPSLHELKVLAAYWLDEQLSSATTCWLHDQVGSEDIRIQPYAGRRVRRIAAVLGEDQLRALVRTVEEKYRKQLGDDAWAAFQRNDTEWRDRELKRVHAEIRRREEKKQSHS